MQRATIRPNRPMGFTLVELLVVIAIIGVLVALLLPAVQAARESARRMQCSNNVKQLVLASHNLHDTYLVFPPAGAAGNAWNGRVSREGPFKGLAGSWFFHILPFIEQSNLYNGAVGAGGGMDSTYNGKLVYNYQLKAYRCPSDRSPGLQRNYGNPAGPDATHALSNYGANYLAFGDPMTGTQEGASKMATFTDGTSNLVFIGERYSWYGTTPLSCLWANSENRWSPQICRAPGSSNSTTAGYAPCPKFQVAVIYTVANDSTSGGQSSHPGVMNIGMGDGSVRGINGSIAATTWAYLCDPQDGNPIPGDF
ncbi:DUF1559 domain-containing protein [Anatilimnocola floriformis]|uniref:DUF1559 domain-containing protein n=1 Tax=Anatilimnocola floriformis TaxID=2948575 RepID=UPI0020C39E5B|nr:DUF1559 domain-containing protein [Anatilimnocola floriformis]